MKNLFFAMVAVTLLFTASCKKSSSSGPGSWSFKGTNYSATSVTGAGSTILGTNLSGSNLNSYNQINFYFTSGSLTTAAGTYPVVSSNSGNTNAVTINTTAAGTTGYSYSSTGNDNAKANVTVSSAGKVTITLSSAILLNDNGTDSSAVTSVTLNQQ